MSGQMVGAAEGLPAAVLLTCVRLHSGVFTKGERKGQNHYYPPDFNPVKHGSLNGYHKTHALRERARKLSQGILIIRFEMPYNIWCDGCKNHIGMGVRYNAEKKKMKCHLCVNYIEMQTDPATCDYVIVTGGSRKEERWDMAENEQILTTEHKEKEKLETDAMFKLDHGGKDKEKMKKALPSLSEIQDYQASKKDDFQLNSSLRRKFRTEKKVIAEQEEKDNMVRLRTNLSIPLLPEKEEDKRLAALLTYQAPDYLLSLLVQLPVSNTRNLLHKLGLQGKEAAVAKALSSSQSTLIRRRSAGPGPRTEPCATATRRNSNPDINTCEGDETPSISPTEMCQDVTETNGSRETHVKTTEEGMTTTKDSGKEKEGAGV
ncbi:hypothetical protein F7725_006169 [Dissostichus mawsoni]|uniref:Probable splicing factor YJU2B n=1 Tax=Dissostichus mawsoni TaxID=36200 RepID=A0A7J5YT91_DISMA|nr:hypothetical protein F7725_006169 [Dissostichus mawsoni]